MIHAKLNNKKTNNLLFLRAKHLYFTKDIQLANKQMKRYLTSCIIMKCKLKSQWDSTTYLFQRLTFLDWLPPVWTRMWRNWNSQHCWWEYTVVKPFGKTVWSFLTKLNIPVSIWLRISLLDGYAREMKAYALQRLVHNCS